MKITCGGGSSIVFRSALKAEGESMCTSSIIYTLYLHIVGAYITSSRSALTSSTPLFDAASISIISGQPSAIALQLSHSPQGLPSTGDKQFTAFAISFAQVVLPVPLEPVNR